MPCGMLGRVCRLTASTATMRAAAGHPLSRVLAQSAGLSPRTRRTASGNAPCDRSHWHACCPCSTPRPGGERADSDTVWRRVRGALCAICSGRASR